MIDTEKNKISDLNGAAKTCVDNIRVLAGDVVNCFSDVLVVQDKKERAMWLEYLADVMYLKMGMICDYAYKLNAITKGIDHYTETE